MNRASFLAALFSPVILLFKKKSQAPEENPVIQNYEFKGPIKPYWFCEVCGEDVPGGLVSLAAHMDKASHKNACEYKGPMTPKAWADFSRILDQSHTNWVKIKHITQ